MLIMVIYSTMDSVVIPRPPALPLTPIVPNTNFLPRAPKNVTLKENTYNQNEGRTRKECQSKVSKNNGFRLIDSPSVEGNSPGNNDDTTSVYSVYKQKIDMMFESDSSTMSTSNPHNVVQAKIEKMFSDVAKDTPDIQTVDMGIHAFSIDYLGSVLLQDKVTSLTGLQSPLKDLYFTYKKASKKKLNGRLEISNQGLRVHYQGPAGDLEQMNSFPTIAVWSAVKFVIQERNAEVSYAFLPLITDPDNMDKQMLFKNLSESEKKYILHEQHSPLFAVIMRKIGVQKQLECHGFVCQTSEDAIVIAATLYKALVNHMKNKEKIPKNRNGLTSCMSIASTSTVMEKNGVSMPVRPPRRKRSSATSSVCSDTNVSETQPLLVKPWKKIVKKKAPQTPNSNQDLNAILPYEEPIRINDADEEITPKKFSDKLNVYMSKEQKEITAEIKQVVTDNNKGLKRVQSLRKLNEDPVCKKENSGDIFTKVTIPRSGSFLNTGGLTRYKNKNSRNNESTSGGSPLGFKEIFHELSMQEGLHSMDDILSVIIDPDGMSFNDLKPIYKEFLLKLAVTLTKDELYLKSKSIMRRQKKKTFKKTSNCKKNKPNKLVSGKFKRLKHIFQKNLKNGISKRLLEGSKVDIRPREIPKADKFPESSISTSSYDTRPFRTKDEIYNKKTNYKRKSALDELKKRRRDRISTSEESDFFSLRRQSHHKKYQNINSSLANQNRNSSSGYVSCSECSYDSDTCTCISADKCYCSLGQRVFNATNHRENQRIPDCRLTYCDCDTDSCAESNKCYCHYGSHGKHESHRRHRQHKELCKKNSNTKSTRSLEYMSNPSEGYYEKLRSRQRYGSERLPETSRQNFSKKRRNSYSGDFSHDFNEVTLENLQMGMAVANKLSSMDYQLLKRKGLNMQEAIYRESLGSYWLTKDANYRKLAAESNCTKALSVKKSAEIAALFADIKLTDIRNMNESGSISTMEHSVNAKYSKPVKTPAAQKSHLTTSIYGRPNVVKNSNKIKMYAAKNGLYTIQSQSDESGSRRSSFTGRINGEIHEKRYETCVIRRSLSRNIESSLGYLP
ncbi:hypothetical protein ABEB36_014316 [Hypothenemus hampei]|uniref:PID domain-containing protein n=1 Tax=Hypothenemus hampei TaxID=57062 RepID=A0ABD1E4C7_HYPHA